MPSISDILIRIRGQDNTGGAFSSVEQKASSMKSMVSSAVGMAAGMIGYDLVNSLVEAGGAAINSSQQLDYYGGRLNLSAKETTNFRNQIDDLQKDFRKVDMTAVGATAESIALKMNLPKEKLADLTKMTATLSSTFVGEGRTQEDAVLAVGDALDGQFKRLQEIGITQDKLKENGWNGNLEDQASLIDALNKTMSEMGYEQTAKDITNLDDAWAALSVAGGRLLADVVIPLTPAFLGLTNAIIGAIDFVKDNGWAQGALLIGGLAVGFGLFAGALSVAAAAEGGLMALMPGFITSLYGAASGFMAISVAGAPLWLIVGALAAVALAVYEIGIYFGWWTDVSSMLAAISAGVQRLWAAFINNPHVKAAIKAVQDALNQLWQFLQPVFSWISEAWVNLFGDSGSNPDIVRGIIDAFGTLGDIASQVFGTISSVAGQVFTALSPIATTIGRIITVISRLFSGEISFEQAVMGIIANFGILSTQIGRLAARAGQLLLQGITNAARRIAPMVWQFLTQTAGRILSFGIMAATYAIQAGLRIFNGIINHVRQIPGRVGAFMRQIPGRISSAAGAAAAAAASLANQAKQAVINGIMGLADAVYNEFIKIGDKIRDSVSSAVSAATNFGNDIKNAVLGALGIASPGIIQRKLAIEFADIPGRIGESSDYVYNAAKDYAGNILKGFNAPQMKMSTLGVVRENGEYSVNGMRNGNVTIVHVHEGAVPVDARNMTKKEAQGVVTLALESLKDPEGTGGA